MKPALVLALVAGLTLAACAEAPPPPAAAPPAAGNVATPAPPPPPGPPLLSAAPPPVPACPADLAAATGKACSLEGQGCGDAARSGFGLVCRAGAWQAGELPHPPCCKK